MTYEETLYVTKADGSVKKYIVQGMRTGVFDIEFNSTHWYEVYKAKRKLNPEERDNTIIDHPLTGRKLLEKSTGNVYNIQSVHRHYYGGGTYIILLVELNGSHGTRYWENENTFANHILEIIKRDRENCEILS